MLLDLLRDGTGAAARFAAQSIANVRYERIENQAGVADQRELGGHVLVDVGRVQRRMHDALAFGHRHAVVRDREAAADAEDQVRVGQEMMQLIH